MQAWEEIAYARRDGIEEGREEIKTKYIKMIMKNTNSTADEAMDLLEIPIDERKKYISML